MGLLEPFHTTLKYLLDKILHFSAYLKSNQTSIVDCLNTELPQKYNMQILMMKENIQKTGYDGIFQEPYESNSKFIETDEDFFVVKEGFNEIIEKLVRQLDSLPNVNLHTNHFIQNISYDKKEYTVTFTIRKKKRLRNT